MDYADALGYGFGEIRELVHAAVEGLSQEQLTWRPDPRSNSIAWLVWHLTRVQDDHVSEIADHPQTWDDSWAERFGLPAGYRDTGYGHSPDQVAAIRPSGPELLTAYHDAVCERTREWLSSAQPADFDRIIDYRWDPPVSVGVRMFSVTSDCLQHVGQAAYVRGLVQRAGI
ncbi:MAG TPA: DUF664 domain-containing protein [Egibacteraceae bacterium]